MVLKWSHLINGMASRMAEIAYFCFTRQFNGETIFLATQKPGIVDFAAVSNK
jgi:hypothetical protein